MNEKDLTALLQKIRPYVQVAHDDAESLHDSDGEYYMDGSQYEIMQTTEQLLKEIDFEIDERTLERNTYHLGSFL